MTDEERAETDADRLPLSPNMKAEAVLQEVLRVLDAQMPSGERKETLLKRMAAIIDNNTSSS